MGDGRRRAAGLLKMDFLGLRNLTILAKAVELILQNAFLLRPDFATPAELIYILALGTLIAILIYRAGALGSAVVGGIAIVAVLGISWYAFDALGWLVDPVYPAIALTAIYLAGTLFVFLRTERERTAYAMPSPITWRPRLSSALPTTRRSSNLAARPAT